jgi:hypothetical protein
MAISTKVTIDRFEGDKAVLKTEDNQTIVWPKNKLPQDVKESSVLNIVLSLDSHVEDTDKKLAKDILNEILNSDKS